MYEYELNWRRFIANLRPNEPIWPPGERPYENVALGRNRTRGMFTNYSKAKNNRRDYVVAENFSDHSRLSKKRNLSFSSNWCLTISLLLSLFVSVNLAQLQQQQGHSKSSNQQLIFVTNGQQNPNQPSEGPVGRPNESPETFNCTTTTANKPEPTNRTLEQPQRDGSAKTAGRVEAISNRWDHQALTGEPTQLVASPAETAVVASAPSTALIQEDQMLASASKKKHKKKMMKKKKKMEKKHKEWKKGKKHKKVSLGSF